VTRQAALVGLVALAFAAAYPMQVNGYNQNAHYALTRALAQGSPSVDDTIGDLGDLSTGDIGRVGGHIYAAKPPGLALLSVPAYAVVSAVGMRTSGDTTRVVWALHLWSIVLPYLMLVVLIGLAADRVRPGYGPPAAGLAALGTLLLPFSTLYFSHVPSACAGFAAFVLLQGERGRALAFGRIVAAGALAGLALSIEYPMALLVVLLGAYALARPRPYARVGAFGLGALLGAAPLFLFNIWAFRDPFHIANQDYFASGGSSEGVGMPRLDDVWALLFSSMGLLVLCPVVACGVVGLLGLWRERRADAAVALAVCVAFTLYPAGLKTTSAFGGLGPPRYLVALLPFAALGLAPALRAFPRTTLALGAVSIFQMVLLTATGPLAAYDGRWLDRATDRTFVQTAASVVGVTGWYTIVPFFVAVAVAAASTVRLLPALRADPRDLALAALALTAWVVATIAADNPNGVPPSLAYALVAAVLAGATALVAARLRPTVELAA
jgi:hypothetical protein